MEHAYLVDYLRAPSTRVWGRGSYASTARRRAFAVTTVKHAHPLDAYECTCEFPTWQVS